MEGQGNCGRRGGVSLSNLFQVKALFGSGEGEEDLSEDWIENASWELPQVVVEGVDVKQVKDWSRQEGEGDAKGQAE